MHHAHRFATGTAIVALGISLIGCSSPNTAPTAAPPSTQTSVEVEITPTTESAPAPQSTPTQLSVDAAAKAYLDIVGPYNTAVEELEDAINSGQPLETQTDKAAATLDALKAEIDQLDSTAWPSEIRPHIEELVAVSEQAVAHWQAAVEASSTEELVQAVLSATEFGGTDVANTIRDLLGLDDYDENA